MGRTTNTTGIGVRGGTAQLGGLSTQPTPFVLPATIPVPRPTSPVTAIVAPSDVAEALTDGRVPSLSIPVSHVVNGTMAAGVADLFPTRLTNLQYQPTTDGSALRLIASNLTNQRRPNEETLSLSQLSIDNKEFQPVSPHGISKLRPEIISLMDYEPIYFGDSTVLNDVGILMDVQYQARHLREQTFFQLMRGIQRSDQSQQLQNIQNEFAASFQRVNSSADFYQNTIIAIETAKNGLDLKTIPGNSFDLRNFRTLADFYESFMMFPRTALSTFAGTKILMQLLFDMRSIAEGYSMNLLNLTDPDRQAGGSAFSSPVAIDRSYNNRNGFSFTYDTVRSFTEPTNAADNQFFTRFNTSLPQAPDDRIKILVNMISKELRVSRGLGRSTVISDLRQKFGATTTDGSPFDNLIGGVGSTIFESVTGPGSLASLTTIVNTGGSVVLPFETKYIDVNNTKKVYIPGSSFFIDSIINIPVLTSFNLTPFRTYVEQFVRTTDSVASLVSNLFDYGEEVSPLCPVEVLKLMLHGVSHGLTFLMSNTQRSGLQISTADAATAAIFRLATTDPALKSMLFQYVLLNLLASSNSHFFADSVAQELLNDIRNLDAVTVNDSYPLPDLRTPNTLQPFISNLGTTIQNRVVQLVNQQTLTHANNAQTRDRAGTLADGRMRVGFDVDITFGIPAALNQSHFLTDLMSFLVGLETILGNEINNVLDATKRSRFNSVSMSTLVLMVFETYTNLISRYVKVDFQVSSFGQNFPDMIVDTNFNAHMQSSIEDVISEPESPLPVLTPDFGTNGAKGGGTKRDDTQRFPRSHRGSSIRQVYNQVRNAAQETGQSTDDVYDGLAENEAILTGTRATAGSRHTNASQLARRGVSRHSNPQDLIDAQAMDRSLDSIVTKLSQEDFAVACAMHILLVIKERLRTTLDVTTNYFSQQTLDNFVSSNGTSLSDIGKNLTPAQARLLLRQRDGYIRDLTANSNQLQFIPVSPTDSNTRGVIMSLLSKAQYRESANAGLRYRLLTVGIPSGFSKNLADRLVGSNLNSTSFQRNKDFDLVYVKVYKRSLEFPQIVFKPKRFLFDLSLFPNGYNNLGIRPSENFDSVLQRITLFDYQNFTNPTSVTLDSIVNNDKYSLIPDPTIRRSLFENHVLSDVFAAYIQALSTMKLNETTFVNTKSETWGRLSLGTNGTDLTPRFAELVRRYLIAQRTREIRTNPALRPLPDLPIQEMLTSSAVDQGTKDTLKLLTFGNIAFKPENALAQLLSPKLFERVFTIPLNVDDFEIDYEATTAPESGREFFEKRFFQNKLDQHAPRGTYRLKPRTVRDVVFEDYFVTIELVE
jgi:hypothetical protein